jgi:hypothetical protein
MRNLKAAVVGGLFVFAFCLAARGDESAVKSTAEINEARRMGWLMAAAVVKVMKTSDLGAFPGLVPWLEDYDNVAKGIDEKIAADAWPALDVDALVTRNPNFWRAYYDIAPGDHALNLMHAGLLLAAGEAMRAQHLLAVGWQRPGMPEKVQLAFRELMAHVNRMRQKPNAIVAEGINASRVAKDGGQL